MLLGCFVIVFCCRAQKRKVTTARTKRGSNGDRGEHRARRNSCDSTLILLVTKSWSMATQVSPLGSECLKLFIHHPLIHHSVVGSALAKDASTPATKNAEQLGFTLPLPLIRKRVVVKTPTVVVSCPVLLDVEGKRSVESNSVVDGSDVNVVVLEIVEESTSVSRWLGVVIAAYVVPFEKGSTLVVAVTTGSAVVAAGVGGGASGRIVHGMYPKQFGKNMLVLHSIALWQISMHAWLTVEQIAPILEGAGSGAVASWLTSSHAATLAHHRLSSPISVDSRCQLMSSLSSHHGIPATVKHKPLLREASGFHGHYARHSTPTNTHSGKRTLSPHEIKRTKKAEKKSKPKQKKRHKENNSEGRKKAACGRACMRQRFTSFVCEMSE